nr:unnamed protein product [Digitaria exilis]
MPRAAGGLRKGSDCRDAGRLALRSGGCGLWVRGSAIWNRKYLSQQLYLRVWTPQQSFSNEYNILTKAILCGRAADLPH